MDSLFGVPTSAIAIVCAALFGVAMLTVGFVFFSNRMMFRMGLRNIPRRGTQTILVVVGLTLSTLIVTAAFATGDTVNYSITKQVYDQYGRSDLNLSYGGAPVQGDFGLPGLQPYAGRGLATAVANQVASDPDVAGVLPYLAVEVPVLDTGTNLSEPAVLLNGFDRQALNDLGGLTLTNGTKADLLGLRDDQAYVSKRAADRLDAKAGDILTIYAGGQEYTVEVAGIVRNEQASGVRGFGSSLVLPGIAMPIEAVGEMTGHSNQINLLNIALKGNVRSSVDKSDAAAERIQAWLDSPAGIGATAPYVNAVHVEVEKSKQESVDNAELMSSIFTTFFLVVGLFSVAAGIMLIFMIFVMLAAERKPEMGMARAVGAQRKNLVQAFVSEGVAYSIVAGAVGAALGVAAAAGLVVGLMRLAGGDSFSFVQAHFTPKSIVIGYTLGVVITFITVVISALRVSHLNIVAAIRGMDEEHEKETRRKISLKWLALSLPAMVIPPLGLYWLLRRGFGLPKAWVWGPLGVIAGALLMVVGKSGELLFPFALGISLLPLALAGIATHHGAPRRVTWSAVAALLSAYWLMPSSLHDRLFGTFKSDIEMFVLSGVMIVISFTLLIVFNARTLTTIFERTADARKRYLATAALGGLTVASAVAGLTLGDAGGGVGSIAWVFAGVLAIGTLYAFVAARFAQIAPAMKMSVAYPLANRFRTGMTIAMFSLIIFSLCVFSILNANFESVFNGSEAGGGTDIVATANRGSSIGDLRAELAGVNAPVAQDISAIGRVTVFSDSQEVRQVGEPDWTLYPVLAADSAFYTEVKPLLDSRAEGYASDADVLNAVATQPGLAVIDLAPVDANVFSIYEWTTSGVTITDNTFAPFQIEVHDPLTGKAATLTVIGTFSSTLDSLIWAGVYTNEATWSAVYGEPRYERAYVNLTGDADAEAAAKSIRSALVADGVQARSVQDMIDESSAENRVFTRIFQGFMGLGLLVGVAALGVIAFRSVTERRQQIGMLRAIGYQSRDISLTFLLESSFIALMGILSGVVGSVILSRNLMNSPSFTEGSTFNFFVPWAEVTTFVAIAFVFSMLMTWWPSRGASRIQIAEALRYE